MAILRIQNLLKAFDGIKAVDDLSFEIEENSIVGLVGPNGSGKTTLFNLITGFLRPERGRIFFYGEEITGFAPYKIARLGIGRTFQNVRLFPQLPVLDNVMLAMRYGREENLAAALFQTKKMREKEESSRREAERLLEYVNLIEKKNALAENLSHGQRKLVDITRLSALEPRIFLFDEPAAGLSPEARKAMLDLLKNLRGKGKTIIFIEHDMNSVMSIAQKIIVLDYGKKIAEGTPEEIRENREVRQIYLGKTGL